MPSTGTEINASPSRVASILKTQFIHTGQNFASKYIPDPVAGTSLIQMPVLGTISYQSASEQAVAICCVHLA